MTNFKTLFFTKNSNQLLSCLLLSVFVISCTEKKKPEENVSPKKDNTTTLFKANTVTQLDGNIRSIIQDKDNNYWFGTNAAGVYRYDGKTVLRFTEKDGLYNNQVSSIQEDQYGTLWFGTGRFGVSRFNGETINTYTNAQNVGVLDKKEWKTTPNDLWFCAGGGVYHYDGNFTYLPLPKTDLDQNFTQNSAHQLSAYAVYSLLKDSKGNLWFGTQSMGVCRFDGNSFTWFTEKGLAGPAVLTIFEDTKGNLWFGNNGAGLFKYDGKSLTNFTKENRLSNDKFVKTNAPGPGTLARVYSINEDNQGDLWIGTVDAGVWRYDGEKLINFTTKDGLTSNAVNTIYKDKKGTLWFGTDANGVCTFEGTSFSKFAIE